MQNSYFFQTKEVIAVLLDLFINKPLDSLLSINMYMYLGPFHLPPFKRVF